MKMLLVSTYELGHQPLAVASPAARLVAEGHEVRAVDTSLSGIELDDLQWADGVAISVPMHTAMRLAQRVVTDVRGRQPDLPLALYGLYADTVAIDGVARFVGEYEDALADWAAGGGSEVPSVRSTGKSSFRIPIRDLLPPLGDYSHLVHDGVHRRVGYTEASHGCRHRCRHCPIPAVYDGRYRIVPQDVIAADIDRLVEMGAEHITFGDPDFLNGPRHSMSVLAAAHRRHPRLGFDVTVKVSHLLDHRELLPDLAANGVVFVISAFESVDDRTLHLLDKGHTTADMEDALRLTAAAGLDVHPSWMPFVPWTTPDHVADAFRFLHDHDLFDVTDPVQMSIRLLVPPGSLMLEIPEISTVVAGYDEESLSYRWDFTDPRTDRLQRSLADMAASAADSGVDGGATLAAMWALALEAADGDPSEAQIPVGATTGRPRMTEPWFC